MTPSAETVLGTLLHEFPAEVPGTINNLLCHSPESFSDLRHGRIAKAIQVVRGTDIEVNVASVLRQLAKDKSDLESDYVRNLLNCAVPLDLAENDAKELWISYQVRQITDTYRQAADTLEDHPERIAEVTDNVDGIVDWLSSNGKAERLTIRKPSELLAMTFDDSDRILGDSRLLATGQSLVLAGAAGVGKSRMLLQLAVCCATGRPFLGFQTFPNGKRWLILQAENTNRRLNSDLDRLRLWVGKEDWRTIDDRLLIHTLESDADGMLSLDHEPTRFRIRDAIERIEPGVVCFDSLYNFSAGDISKDNDMRETLGHVSKLARSGDPGRSIVVLHHSLTGKVGAARATGFDRSSFGRNSKVLFAWARAQINIAPGSPDTNDSLIVACGKCSNGPEFASFAIRLNPGTLIYEPDSSFDMESWLADVAGQKAECDHLKPDAIRELCTGSPTKVDLVKALMAKSGCSRPGAYKAIDRAERKKAIHYSKASETYARSKA